MYNSCSGLFFELNTIEASLVAYVKIFHMLKNAPIFPLRLHKQLHIFKLATEQLTPAITIDWDS